MVHHLLLLGFHHQATLEWTGQMGIHHRRAGSLNLGCDRFGVTILRDGGLRQRLRIGIWTGQISIHHCRAGSLNLGCNRLSAANLFDGTGRGLSQRLIMGNRTGQMGIHYRGQGDDYLGFAWLCTAILRDGIPLGREGLRLGIFLLGRWRQRLIPE